MSSENRPRLLYAARRAPWPLDNGARIRAHHLVSGLAAAFATTLIVFQHQLGSADGPTDLSALAASLPGVEILTVPGLGSNKRAAQAIGLLRARSFNWGRYQRRVFRAELVRLAAERQPQVVHYDDLGSALNGPVAAPLNVYSSHNVEHMIAGGAAHTGSLPRRAFNRLESARILREERRVYGAMDLVLAVSPDDAATMRAQGAQRVELCPNGTAPVGLLARATRAPDEPLRILFVGSGAYGPYERGLAWFVSRVLPRVREQTAAIFDVVGQPPRRPVAAEGVTYAGRVPSVTPYYERAHVVVVPVFEGSGTRLKIIEAAAYGRPVVSTALGAQGLGLVPGEHYLEAEDPEAFAAAVVRLGAGWRQPHSEELDGLVRAARAEGERYFWPSISDELVALYRSELAARAVV